MLRQFMLGIPRDFFEASTLEGANPFQIFKDIYLPLAQHTGDLMRTLDAYWATGTSIEATARRLFIHANTVRYRLGRVEDLTGYAPSDPRGGYVLRLAGTLGRLLTEP